MVRPLPYVCMCCARVYANLPINKQPARIPIKLTPAKRYSVTKKNRIHIIHVRVCSNKLWHPPKAAPPKLFFFSRGAFENEEFYL